MTSTLFRDQFATAAEVKRAQGHSAAFQQLQRLIFLADLIVLTDLCTYLHTEYQFFASPA